MLRSRCTTFVARTHLDDLWRANTRTCIAALSSMFCFCFKILRWGDHLDMRRHWLMSLPYCCLTKHWAHISEMFLEQDSRLSNADSRTRVALVASVAYRIRFQRLNFLLRRAGMATTPLVSPMKVSILCIVISSFMWGFTRVM